jgi:hypothetical protein
MPRDMLCRCDCNQGESITATHTSAAPTRQQADDESHGRESMRDTTSAATDDEVPRASPITDATHSRTTQQRRFISTPQLSGALFMYCRQEAGHHRAPATKKGVIQNTNNDAFAFGN